MSKPVLAPVEDEFFIPFSLSGTLTTGVGTARFPMPYAAQILGVRAAVGTAPTGAAAIFDVNKNGTTIFTTQGNRPQVAAAANQGAEAVPDVSTLAAGDYLTVDRDQVGSTVAGADATLVIRLRRK